MDLFKQVAAKLQISEDELWELHRLPECTEHYKSQEWLYSLGIKLFTLLGIEKRIRK